MNEIHIDSLLPAEMAEKAESIGVRKANMQFFTMLMLSILAGAFIAFGSIFATTVSAGAISVSGADGALAYSTALPYGVTRLLTGLVFCLGLILVVVGGAELFTGNNLIVMAWASKRVTTSALLRNWVIVYVGNFIGAVGTAVLMFFSKQYTFGSDSVGIAARIKKEPNNILFEVRDTGIGIPEEKQELVFEAFETILEDKSDPRLGFGLGLKIVEHIISLHDGETWFESKEDAGSSFFFTIPIS